MGLRLISETKVVRVLSERVVDAGFIAVEVVVSRFRKTASAMQSAATTLLVLILSVLCIGLLTAGRANAALIATDGGLTVYSAATNLSWLANANLAMTHTFGLATGVDLGTVGVPNPVGPSVIYADGSMTWGGAIQWIAAMNVANYLGYSDWRLPTSDTCAGYNCTGSEMGNLFYNELGGVAGVSILTTHNADLALFNNVQSGFYWLGSEYAPDTSQAWRFDTNNGYQFVVSKGTVLTALAVRPGQVAAVPEPSTTLLFGVGLLAMIGVVRRRLALR